MTLGCMPTVSILGTLFCVAYARPAYTYLHPSTGSYIFQPLIAGVVGVAFVIKVFWGRIKGALPATFPKPKSRQRKSKMTGGCSEVTGAFRDPIGYIHLKNDQICRQVSRAYQDDFDLLIDSGLCQQLVGDGLLIHHTEVGLENAASDDGYKVIGPQQISFISHPVEWCFSQLKGAALLTREIQCRVTLRMTGRPLERQEALL